MAVRRPSCLTSCCPGGEGGGGLSSQDKSLARLSGTTVKHWISNRARGLRLTNRKKRRRKEAKSPTLFAWFSLKTWIPTPTPQRERSKGESGAVPRGSTAPPSYVNNASILGLTVSQPTVTLCMTERKPSELGSSPLTFPREARSRALIQTQCHFPNQGRPGWRTASGVPLWVDGRFSCSL